MNNFCVLLILVFLSPILFTFYAVAASPPDSWEFSKESATLRVALLGKNNFPFVYKDKVGKWAGFEIEMIKDLKEALDVNYLQFKVYPNHETLVAALLDNEVDCAVSKLKINLKDAERLLYSQPYIELDSVFLINRKLRARMGLQTALPVFKNTNTASRLPNKHISIGTMDNPALYNQISLNYPDIRVIKVKTLNELISMVTTDQLFACCIDEARAKKLFLHHPEKALLLAFHPWKKQSESIAFAFSWKNEPLRDWINIFLQARGIPAADLDELIKSN